VIDRRESDHLAAGKKEELLRKKRYEEQSSTGSSKEGKKLAGSKGRARLKKRGPIGRDGEA